MDNEFQEEIRERTERNRLMADRVHVLPTFRDASQGVMGDRSGSDTNLSRAQHDSASLVFLAS